jgi:hypothetical protein
MNNSEQIENEPSPADMLLAYMRDMNAWETQWFERLNHRLQSDTPELPAFWKQVNMELEGICSRYLTLKKRSPGHGGSLGSPPAYDPDTEEVIEMVYESPGRAVIYTERQIGALFRYRHVAL